MHDRDDWSHICFISSVLVSLFLCHDAQPSLRREKFWEHVKVSLHYLKMRSHISPFSKPTPREKYLGLWNCHIPQGNLTDNAISFPTQKKQYELVTNTKVTNSYSLSLMSLQCNLFKNNSFIGTGGRQILWAQGLPREFEMSALGAVCPSSEFQMCSFRRLNCIWGHYVLGGKVVSLLYEWNQDWLYNSREIYPFEIKICFMSPKNLRSRRDGVSDSSTPESKRWFGSCFLTAKKKDLGLELFSDWRSHQNKMSKPSWLPEKNFKRRGLWWWQYFSPWVSLSFRGMTNQMRCIRQVSCIFC